jgi:hypothetical protein
VKPGRGSDLIIGVHRDLGGAVRTHGDHSGARRRQRDRAQKARRRERQISTHSHIRNGFALIRVPRLCPGLCHYRSGGCIIAIEGIVGKSHALEMSYAVRNVADADQQISCKAITSWL